MPDDKSKKGSPDSKRIDIKDPDEVRNWSNALKCTPAKLKEAVAAVGTSAEKVKQYLNK